MIELGELDAHHADFAARHARIVAVSLDGLDETAMTQAKFPHLVIVSDAGRKLASAAEVIGPHHGPSGEDTTAPTTFLIDTDGRVRWLFRPNRYIERIAPAELLKKLD